MKDSIYGKTFMELWKELQKTDDGNWTYVTKNFDDGYAGSDFSRLPYNLEICYYSDDDEGTGSVVLEVRDIGNPNYLDYEITFAVTGAGVIDTAGTPDFFGKKEAEWKKEK